MHQQLSYHFKEELRPTPARLMIEKSASAEIVPFVATTAASNVERDSCNWTSSFSAPVLSKHLYSFKMIQQHLNQQLQFLHLKFGY